MKFSDLARSFILLGPWIIGATLVGCGAETAAPPPWLCGGLPVPADIDDNQGLFDLGHSRTLKRLIQSGDRVLSQDEYDGRWILWDSTTHLAVTSGPNYTYDYANMAGNLVIIQTATGLDLLNATTGELQGTIDGGPSSFAQIGIADDGSYVWAALANGCLEAWSPQGDIVLNVPGDYSRASIFAAPAEIRVAKGPAGADRIETLPIGGGQATLSPTFSHNFHRWMDDGERFFATVGTAVFIYSKQASLITSAVLPTIEGLRGRGDHFWTFPGSTPGYPLRIYDINSGDTPVVTYEYGPSTALFPWKQGIGVIYSNEPEVHFIHLDKQVTREVIPVPFSYLKHLAVDDATGNWTIANWSGVIYQHGTSQDPQVDGTLSCGAVLDMASTPTGWAAIALASKQVLILDMNAGGEVEKVLPVLAERVQISDDGSVLAAWGGYLTAYYLGTKSNTNIEIFSLPSGEKTHTFTDSGAFSLSRNGERIGLTSFPAMTRQVANLDGSLTFWDDNSSIEYPPLPSPNGTHIAAPDGADSDQMVTSLFLADPMGGTAQLINVLPGKVVGWIDDNQMLAYTRKKEPGSYEYDKTIIYDAQGVVIATPPFPNIVIDFDVISSSTIYLPVEGTAYDVMTGEALWSNELKSKQVITPRAATGNRVLFAYENGVYIAPF